MPSAHAIEIPISGMDCPDCARHVQRALEVVPGVQSAKVLLAAERAVIVHDDSHQPSFEQLRQAVERAGYGVPEATSAHTTSQAAAMSRQVFRILGLVFGTVIFTAVVGEWLGLFDALTRDIALPIGWAIVLFIGYPALAQVIRAGLKGQVIAHTLMAVGLVAALLAGEWVTAAVVAFFMRVGDYVERMTTDQARESVRKLTSMAPAMARVEHGPDLVDMPVAQVPIGARVVVRPGERVPVDGIVRAGRAAVDVSSLTGESALVDVAGGVPIYAGSIVHEGAIELETTAVGGDTSFGRIIRLVEEAESARGAVQRVADRFSGYYLPVVGLVALSTYLIRGDLPATVAVLVVACSCAFALATPVAMLASIGSGARRGLLIKGGRVIETLRRVDVVLLDKTGTVTFGRPQITAVLPLADTDPNRLLSLAFSVERFSEHPLGAAVRKAAREAGLEPLPADAFEALPGQGVAARVDGSRVTVGRLGTTSVAHLPAAAAHLREKGETILQVTVDGVPVGILAASDVDRPDVARAIEHLRDRGARKLLMLTGDHEQAGRLAADRLGIPFHAELLPQDKITIVRALQQEGHVVAMIGDGVNDAPALAQADVGIAMGLIGSDVALEAADVILLRDDWTAIPDLFDSAKRTMRVVYGNLGFTGLYNIVGLSLAALGVLSPLLAAAAQSLPDLGILANSARLLRR